jgi:site-specific recombinase XerD
VLSDPEIGDVLSVTRTARDRALLATLLGAGLRVAEAVALDVRDVVEDIDGGTVLSVRHGKGRKSRLVPVQLDVAQLIRTYLAMTHRHLGDDGPLFRAHDYAGWGRRRLSARTVVSVVKREVRRAGIRAKRVSPHALRHVFAIRALRGGGNVVAIAKLLGHATIGTTQRYVDHLTLGELREAIPLLPVCDG